MLQLKPQRLTKELLSQWDKVLQENGFVDIERTIDGERVLLQYASNAYRQTDPVLCEAKLCYYQMISVKLHETIFASDRDKIVMEMLADGSTIKEIVRELFKCGIRLNRNTVTFIIRRYENSWGIRKWSLAQMNLKAPIK